MSLSPEVKLMEAVAACAALPIATSGRRGEQRSSGRRSDEKVQLQAASRFRLHQQRFSRPGSVLALNRPNYLKMSNQPQKITIYPPLRVHTTTPLSAAEIQPLISAYLTQSLKKPCLHPDAWLRPEGVRHGFKGGPSGGFIMHHLRRIEAGLRGESLQPETTKELVEKFGEEAVREATGLSLGEVQAAVDFGVDYTGKKEEEQGEEGFAGPGNDTAVEKTIQKGEDERARRRREKKERKEREKAAKRGAEDAAEGAASSSKKRKVDKGQDASGENEWMSKEEWEQKQPILEGEVGEREGAPVVRQDGKPPVVVEHDEKGNVKQPEQGKREYTAEEKAARKAAKKARRLEALPA